MVVSAKSVPAVSERFSNNAMRRKMPQALISPETNDIWQFKQLQGVLDNPPEIPKNKPAVHATIKSGLKRDSELLELTAATVNNVTVAGGNSWVNDGVETGQSCARVAWHAPEGIGGAR